MIFYSACRLTVVGGRGDVFASRCHIDTHHLCVRVCLKCIHVYTNMKHTDAYGIRMFSPSGATSTHFRCHIDTSSVRACLSRVFEYICILCVCVFGVHVYTIRTNDTSPVCASLSRMWQCVPKVYLKCT